MALSQKTKGLLIIIVFISIMILPVCYVFVKERWFSHSEIKTTPPVAVPETTNK